MAARAYGPESAIPGPLLRSWFEKNAAIFRIAAASDGALVGYISSIPLLADKFEQGRVLHEISGNGSLGCHRHGTENILRRVKESCFAAFTTRTTAEVFGPLLTKTNEAETTN